MFPSLVSLVENIFTLCSEYSSVLKVSSTDTYSPFLPIPFFTCFPTSVPLTPAMFVILLIVTPKKINYLYTQGFPLALPLRMQKGLHPLLTQLLFHPDKSLLIIDKYIQLNKLILSQKIDKSQLMIGRLSFFIYHF